jgi:hypothetical protein
MSTETDTAFKPRYPRTGNRPNPLRDWLQQRPKPMTKIRFAELLGITPTYVSQLISDNPPWPKRELACRIGVITQGAVTPNDLAGYPND